MTKLFFHCRTRKAFLEGMCRYICYHYQFSSLLCTPHFSAVKNTAGSTILFASYLSETPCVLNLFYFERKHAAQQNHSPTVLTQIYVKVNGEQGLVPG